MANLSNINGKFVVEQTTGFVGVGTTDPDYLLHLASTDTTNGTRLAIQNINTNGKIYGLISDNTGVFSLRDLTAGADRLTISSGGNATFAKEISSGDDINCPTKIVIGESAKAELRLKKTATGRAGVFFYMPSNTETSYIELDASEDMVYYGYAGVDHKFYAGTSLNLTLSGTDATFGGSITVGTGNSSIAGDLYFGVNADIFKTGTLTITATTAIQFLNDANNQYTGYFYNSDTGSGANGLNVQTATTAATAYAFRVNSGSNTNALTVMGNANVGIGTNSPDAKLHIYGSSTVSEMYLGEDAAVDKAGILKYNQGDGSGTGSVQLGNYGDSLNTTGVTIKKGGKVGIGDADPAYRLSVTGSLDERVQINSTANKTAGIYMRVISSGTQVGTGTIATQNDGNMKFFTGTSGEAVAMTLDTDGRLQDTAGIYLGSNNNNQLLNYYKEDTWTPQIYYQNSTDQLASQNTTQTGLYTKIGNTVLVQFRLIWTITGTPAVDNIGIKNLPWQGHATNAFAEIPCFIKNYTGGPSPRGNLTLTLPTANQTLALFNDTNFIGNMGNAIGTGTHEIRFSFTYLTN